MSGILFNFFIAAILLLTLSSKGSSRSRLILFNILVFMTMGGIQFEVPILGSGMRSYLAFLLLIVSDKAVLHALALLKATRILASTLTLALYIVFSHVILSGVLSFKIVFEHVGNFGFFLLCVASLLNGTRRQIIWFLVSMGAGLLFNIFTYMPAWVPFFSGMSFFGPVPHYQLPASSGLLMLPMVLMLFHALKKIRSKLFTLAGLAFLTLATFLTGARTPTAAYVFILAFYRRKVWWTALMAALGVLAFSLLPENTQTERMVSRIQQLSSAAQTGTLQENPDAGMRLENIRIALDGFSERPLFGWGIESWSTYRQEHTGTMGYSLAAHSGFALLLMETGLVGVIIYFVFVFRCLRGIRLKFTGSLVEDIGYVAVLGTIAILIVSIGGDTLLRRGSFTFFSLGAFCRCYKFRSLMPGRAQTGSVEPGQGDAPVIGDPK